SMCCRHTTSLFIIILPLPPCSTLFPYTTLFRSPYLKPGANLDLARGGLRSFLTGHCATGIDAVLRDWDELTPAEQADFETSTGRSEEHTSELQSRENLVCRLLLEKKKYTNPTSG